MSARLRTKGWETRRKYTSRKYINDQSPSFRSLRKFSEKTSQYNRFPSNDLSCIPHYVTTQKCAVSAVYCSSSRPPSFPTSYLSCMRIDYHRHIIQYTTCMFPEPFQFQHNSTNREVRKPSNIFTPNSQWNLTSNPRFITSWVITKCRYFQRMKWNRVAEKTTRIKLMRNPFQIRKCKPNHTRPRKRLSLFTITERSLRIWEPYQRG